MSEVIPSEVIRESPTRRVSEIRRVLRVMFGRWVVSVSAFVILVFVIAAIFAPLLAPYDPNEQNLSLTLQPPSATYRLGTDDLGRDILSRLIWGSRISIMVGIVGVTIAGVFGMGLGLIAGYYGGWTYSIIMRLVDALMSLPPLLLILAIAAVLGGGLFNVLIAIGVGLLPTYCRLMCSQVLALKNSDYVAAAKSLGASDGRIIARHLLPNSFPPLLVLITLNMGSAILMEASLSFLGIGIAPPAATWGAMISNGQMYLLTIPLLSFIPGFCILFVVLSFNMVGDGLRDALDPRLRGTM